MVKTIKNKNQSVLEEQEKMLPLSDVFPKELLQQERSTNVEEMTEVGLNVWQDGFFDKYRLLPKGYKIAAAFFITIGVLGILSSFVLFPTLESTTGSMEQIKGILLLTLGSVFILTSMLGHYFHIRSLKGASGLDEEMMELAEKKLRREKLLAPYRKIRADEKLRERKDKKKHRSKDQKKSHKNKKAETINTVESGAQPITENKKQSEKEENKQESTKKNEKGDKKEKENEKNAQKNEVGSGDTIQEVSSFDTSNPKKKKHKKKNAAPSKDGAINSDVFSTATPSVPPSPPPPFSMPTTTMPREMKQVGPAGALNHHRLEPSAEYPNDAKKEVPMFSSKASSTIQARGAALAGLFKPNKEPLVKGGRPAVLSSELT